MIGIIDGLIIDNTAWYLMLACCLMLEHRCVHLIRSLMWLHGSWEDFNQTDIDAFLARVFANVDFACVNLMVMTFWGGGDENDPDLCFTQNRWDNLSWTWNRTDQKILRHIMACAYHELVSGNDVSFLAHIMNSYQRPVLRTKCRIARAGKSSGILHWCILAGIQVKTLARGRSVDGTCGLWWIDNS